MIDISKGRYWDEGIKLVSGCTKCSPGCDHCWSLGMEKRFRKPILNGRGVYIPDTTIEIHPDRLSRFNTRKPKVFAIWNDLFHEAVPWEFQYKVYTAASNYPQNTILVLTKRPGNMVKSLKDVIFHLNRNGIYEYNHIWHGLTVCNQQEADEKIPIFLQVPGKKFLSIEPMLGPVDLNLIWRYGEVATPNGYGLVKIPLIDAVILGGETGHGASKMHPDWVRSVRDQCAAAGVPFFFKSWGAWQPSYAGAPDDPCNKNNECYTKDGIPIMFKTKKVQRIIDDRTHNDLPWVKKGETKWNP